MPPVASLKLPIKEPVLPEKPAKIPPAAPDIKPDLRASPILPPLTSVPIPDPRAAPNTGPNGPNTERAIGNTTGNAFLTTLTTPFIALPIPLNIFFKKNSGNPVSGLRSFSSAPTT